VHTDTARWSGDGTLTQQIVARLQQLPAVAALRIEDAPSSREDAGYLFIANEVFVTPVATPRRWFGRWPFRQPAPAPPLLDVVAAWLAEDHAIGTPDFADAGMLQFLRTERVIPAYQTRGYKLVEMARIYMVGNPFSASGRKTEA
jgi:hypothetical protein